MEQPNKSLINKYRISDLFQIIILFVLSFIVVYFLPVVIQRIYFILLLVFYSRSKNNYFWLAFVFIILSAPAGIFIGKSSIDTQQIPIYTIFPSVSFSFFELFIFTSIGKYIFDNRKNHSYYFKKGVNVVILFGVILLLFSLIIGMDMNGIINVGRFTILPILLLLIAPFLIKNKNEFIKIIKILIPFVLLSFIGQFYSIIFGKLLVSIVKYSGSVRLDFDNAINETNYEIIRNFDAEYLNTFVLIVCGYLLLRNRNDIKPQYLILAITASFITCFTSATRGPFLMYIFIVGILIILAIRNTPQILGRNIGSVFLVFSIILVGFSYFRFNDQFSNQLKYAGLRLGTIQNIAAGDYETAEKRMDERIPILLKMFEESPIIGWGFSKAGLATNDGHLGIHNMLREGGILEILVFLYLFIQIMYQPFLLKQYRRISIYETTAIRFFAIAIISILIQHSTSTQFFGYYIEFDPYPKWLMLILLLLGINIFYRNAKQNIISKY